MLQRMLVGTRRQVPPIHGVLRLALVFCFFVLITAVLFKPWIEYISTILIGPPTDNMQDFWNSWYAAVAANRHEFFFTKLIRFPEGTSLQYHSFCYLQVFAVAVITEIIGLNRATLISVHNLTLLFSFPLAGTGAFLLVRRFAHLTWASLVGGYVFAFSPWHVQQVMFHAHTSEIGFIPFFVFAYLEAIDRKSVQWLVAAIFFYTLSALCSWYYLFYLAFFVIFHTTFMVFHDRVPLRGWELRAPLLCLGGTAVLLAPLLIPMALTSSAKAYDYGWNAYVIDLPAFLMPPQTHLLSANLGSRYRDFSDFGLEGVAYLGIVNVGLLCWLGVRHRSTKLPVWYVFAGIITFSVLAFGMFLHAFHYNLWIPLPDILFVNLPFVANIRTPARTVVMVYLFLSIGVGCALALAWSETPTIKRRALAIAAAVLLTIDFVPSHLLSTQATCPGILQIIRDDPEHDFGVLNWPRNYPARNEPMLQQTCHGRPVVLAVVSRVLSPSLIDRIEARNLVRQREQLRRAKVKYIVMRPPGTGLAEWMPEDGAFAPYLDTYPIVARSPDFIVFKVYGVSPLHQ
jgi:hypothetical protein